MRTSKDLVSANESMNAQDKMGSSVSGMGLFESRSAQRRQLATTHKQNSHKMRCACRRAHNHARQHARVHAQKCTCKGDEGRVRLPAVLGTQLTKHNKQPPA